MSDSPQLSHFNASGQTVMVDVSAKQPTRRTATASAFVELSAAVLAALPANPRQPPRGGPLRRNPGSQAYRDLIPMCHPLPLSHIDLQAEIVSGGCVSAPQSHHRATGVEMEALTAAAVAALTVYDMTKALDKSIVIRNIQLEEKSGGKAAISPKENPRIIRNKVVILSDRP